MIMHVRKNYAALQIVSITIIIVPKMAFKKGSNNLWWLATARLDGITELSINNILFHTRITKGTEESRRATQK